MLIPIVAATLSKWISFGQCRVTEIIGFNAQGDLYIQLFEASPVSAAVILANGTVPKAKSFLAQGANGFKYEFVGGLDFAELTVAVSTTEANLTAPGAGGGIDFTLVVDGPYLVANYPGITIAGDFVANAASPLQVWSDANGPKRLARLDITDTSGLANTIIGYAVDVPLAGSKKQFSVPVGANGVANMSCGQGFSPLEKLASDQSLHDGLTLTSAGTAAIRAIYFT